MGGTGDGGRVRVRAEGGGCKRGGTHHSGGSTGTTECVPSTSASGVSLVTSRMSETMEYTFSNQLGHKDAQITFQLPEGATSGKAVVTYHFL